MHIHPSSARRPGRVLSTALACALGLGACAQTSTSRMGGPSGSPADSSSERSSERSSSDVYTQQPRRAERQRQPALPGDVNRTDSNLERPDQLPKSGPPSTNNPEQ